MSNVFYKVFYSLLPIQKEVHITFAFKVELKEIGRSTLSEFGLYLTKLAELLDTIGLLIQNEVI